MKLTNLYQMALFAVLLLALSCKSDDEIPERVEPIIPPTPPVEEVYNEPDFVPHKEGDPFNSYRGLVMTGYQGWFCCPGSGCSHGNAENTKWYHYRESEVFEPGPKKNSIDMWPDVREYEKLYTPDHFVLPNGQKPQVYSNYDKSTVMLHFKWMKEYGIDGAFMQRFVGEIHGSQGKDHFDKVLSHAMEASNTHQRAIAVMYDLGGFQPDRLASTLVDAREIMDKYQLKDRTKQKFYLHQNDKPLITMWGVGFNDNRPFSLDDVQMLMDGLKEMGYSIMLGVPTYWRERRNDALADPKLHDIIKASDVIMPWFVGRYSRENFSEFHSLIEQDVKWCKENGVEYAPLCFPGSSDLNMHPHHAHRNDRHGGRFLWDQVFHSVKSGAQMLYMAMFDEIDEGTALYKVLNNKDVPSNLPNPDYWVIHRQGGNYTLRTLSQGALSSVSTTDPVGSGNWQRLASQLVTEEGIKFIGIDDDLPTDHYLWLTGQARKMLRGEIPLSQTLPTR